VGAGGRGGGGRVLGLTQPAKLLDYFPLPRSAAGKLTRQRVRRAGPEVTPGPARRGCARCYCTTDHTKVAVPDTPAVSFAVTVTV
jgi:hypothetical protein